MTDSFALPNAQKTLGITFAKLHKFEAANKVHPDSRNRIQGLHYSRKGTWGMEYLGAITPENDLESSSEETQGVTKPVKGDKWEQ